MSSRAWDIANPISAVLLTVLYFCMDRPIPTWLVLIYVLNWLFAVLTKGETP